MGGSDNAGLMHSYCDLFQFRVFVVQLRSKVRIHSRPIHVYTCNRPTDIGDLAVFEQIGFQREFPARRTMVQFSQIDVFALVLRGGINKTKKRHKIAAFSRAK